MILHLYKILSAFAAPIFAPCFAAYSLVTGEKRRGLMRHFGLAPSPETPAGRKTLWLHALSVGEVGSAVPLLALLKERRSDIRIVVSVTTDAGYDAARKQLGFADSIIFHPLDLWPFPAIATARIRPDLFVLTETGFWPCLLHVLARKKIPSLLFQGRISAKSTRRYRAILPLISGVLNSFETLCMQDEEGVENARSLGADPDKTRWIGNAKYDVLQAVPDERRRQIRERLKLSPESLVFVAGSTHEREEDVVLDVFNKLKTQFPALTLIVAPRRLERVEEIARLFAAKGIKFEKRSRLNDAPGASAILLDTIGELSETYAIADAVFVGKSLFPPGGGHSLIEPAAHGKMVLHGPYVEYNQEAADELGKQGIAIRVKDKQELESAIRDLLADKTLRNKMEQTAGNFIESKKGATGRMVEIILQKLNGK